MRNRPVTGAESDRASCRPGRHGAGRPRAPQSHFPFGPGFRDELIGREGGRIGPSGPSCVAPSGALWGPMRNGERSPADYLRPRRFFEPGGRGLTAVAFSGFGDRARPDRTSVLAGSLPACQFLPRTYGFVDSIVIA